MSYLFMQLHNNSTPPLEMQAFFRFLLNFFNSASRPLLLIAHRRSPPAAKAAQALPKAPCGPLNSPSWKRRPHSRREIRQRPSPPSSKNRKTASPSLHLRRVCGINKDVTYVTFHLAAPALPFSFPLWATESYHQTIRLSQRLEQALPAGNAKHTEYLPPVFRAPPPVNGQTGFYWKSLHNRHRGSRPPAPPAAFAKVHGESPPAGLVFFSSHPIGKTHRVDKRPYPAECRMAGRAGCAVPRCGQSDRKPPECCPRTAMETLKPQSAPMRAS